MLVGLSPCAVIIVSVWPTILSARLGPWRLRARTNEVYDLIVTWWRNSGSRYGLSMLQTRWRLFSGSLLMIVCHLEFNYNASTSLPRSFVVSVKDWRVLSILLFSVLMPGKFGTRLNELSTLILSRPISPLQGSGSSTSSLGHANTMQLLWLCQSVIYGMCETMWWIIVRLPILALIWRSMHMLI